MCEIKTQEEANFYEHGFGGIWLQLMVELHHSTARQSGLSAATISVPKVMVLWFITIQSTHPIYIYIYAYQKTHNSLLLLLEKFIMIVLESLSDYVTPKCDCKHLSDAMLMFLLRTKFTSWYHILHSWWSVFDETKLNTEIFPK